MKILYFIIPFLVGTFLPIQGGINNLLAKGLGAPIPASFISFLGGTLILGLLLLLTRYSFPEAATLKSFPFYYWLGGLLGVMFVTSVIIIAPITGTVVFFSISLAGQFFISLIIDHYGFFNIAKHEINPLKIAGIFLILVGTYVIQYSKS